MAMIKLKEVTVGSGGAASITFNNINQTGDDLVIFGKLRSTDSNTSVYVILNPTESAYYVNYVLQSFRAAESSARNVNTPGKDAHATDSSMNSANFGSWHAIIPNYTEAGVTMLSDYGSAEGVYGTIGSASNVHSTTNPVDEITIYPITSFAEGTKISLYMTKG